MLMVKRRPKKDPVTVATVLPRVLSDLGFSSAARVLRIQEHWGAAVGAEVAAHASPAVLRGETLEVTVDSPVWGQQLALRGPELLAALRQILGDDAPTVLKTRVG